MSSNGSLSEYLPSWKGQLNIAKCINKRKDLNIPDDVFFDLKYNRPEMPSKESVVLVLDIKLNTPENTMNVLLECLHRRYKKCSVSNGICANKDYLNLWPTIDWKPGISWKLIDLKAFKGFSTIDVRNIVSPNCLPSSSLGWVVFYSRMTMDGYNIPFMKASGFDVRVNGHKHDFSNTVGFRVKDGAFHMSCPETDQPQLHWSNPVLIEA